MTHVNRLGIRTLAAILSATFAGAAIAQVSPAPGGVSPGMPRPIGQRQITLPKAPPRSPSTAGGQGPALEIRYGNGGRVWVNNRGQYFDYRPNNRGVYGSPYIINQYPTGCAGGSCGVYYYDRDTVQVRGTYQGERFRAAFEINLAGPAIATTVGSRVLCPAPTLLGPIGYLDWYRWSPWRYYYFRDQASEQWFSDGQRSVYGTLSRIDYSQPDPFVTSGAARSAPAGRPAAVIEVRKPLTLAERGDLHMQESALGSAIDSYREYLASSDTDASVMRRLAVALLEQNKVVEAVAMLAMAYDSDPDLAATPLDLSALGLNKVKRFEQLLARANIYAARTRTASAILLQTALLQGAGRTDAARRTLDRAIEAGLEARVADRFRDALTK
ncbi:MAG: hypothetical protein KIT68_11830 [Phycisphaeraceae bacterium]|nr:hypothetical protein [Phycisphaeraceae bacterium]